MMYAASQPVYPPPAPFFLSRSTVPHLSSAPLYLAVFFLGLYAFPARPASSFRRLVFPPPFSPPRFFFSFFILPLPPFSSPSIKTTAGLPSFARPFFPLFPFLHMPPHFNRFSRLTYLHHSLSPHSLPVPHHLPPWLPRTCYHAIAAV